MAKKSLRRLVVDQEAYLWRFVPGYARSDRGETLNCEDVLVVYREGQPTSGLRIHFRTWEDPVVGGPLRVGAPLDATGGVRWNLHTPGAVSEIIRRALHHGWAPSAPGAPLTIEDGVALLR